MAIFSCFAFCPRANVRLPDRSTGLLTLGDIPANFQSRLVSLLFYQKTYSNNVFNQIKIK